MLKSTLGIAIAFSLCAVAHAANQGQGVVNFKGTVIDAPCGIDRTQQIRLLTSVRFLNHI